MAEDLAAMPPARLPFPVTRALAAPIETRASDTAMPTMVGHFSTFGDWYEVNSMFEGHFLERIAPKAFDKTIRKSNADRASMKVLYDHGQDPQIGNKILGPIEDLRTDNVGPAYVVPLFDTSYNRDLAPGLEAGVYGSSFRFTVEKDEWDQSPGRSDYNPDGIPERTITEARVYEFGPVTFPANPSATAGVRSTTDTFYQRSRDPEGFDALLRSAQVARTPASAGAAAVVVEPPPADAPVEPPPSDAPAAPPPERAEPIEDPQTRQTAGSLDSREETDVSDTPIQPGDRPARITELRSLADSFAKEHTGVLSTELQAEWDGMTAELRKLEADHRADEQRKQFIADRAVLDGAHVEAPATFTPKSFNAPRQRVGDIYSFGEIRAASNGDADERILRRDCALRAIESAVFPSAPDRARAADQVDYLIRSDKSSAVAERVLATGSPAYRRFFEKYVAGQMLSVTPEEQRAAALTGLIATTTTGGFAVVYELDPTIIPTSNGAVNPYRRMSKVVQTVSNEYRAVTSGGVVAAYAGEAATATEQGPTLAQPAAIVQKAHTFVTYSIEAGQDIQDLTGQLATMISDSKDVLEADKFTTGAGTTVFPQGITVGATGTLATGTTTVLAAADLYSAEATLQPRFRPNARILASRFIYNKIRAIDTAGGAQLWTQNLQAGLPNRVDGNTGYNLLGYPADECSSMAASLALNTLELVIGDFSYFVIVDKIGMNVELIPLMTDGSTPSFPTGQRGLYAYWRNTSKVLASGAFVVLKGA